MRRRVAFYTVFVSVCVCVRARLLMRVARVLALAGDVGGEDVAVVAKGGEEEKALLERRGVRHAKAQQLRRCEVEHQEVGFLARREVADPVVELERGTLTTARVRAWGKLRVRVRVVVRA